MFSPNMKIVLRAGRLPGADDDEDEGLGKPTPIDDPPEELVIAAGEILAALGQDYGMSGDASESRRAEFWDKARRLAARLQDFVEICDASPHEEGEHTDEK